MSRPALIAWICLCTLSALAPTQAGTVQVDFVQPDTYADAGRDARSREEVQAGLTQHLRRLGEALPGSQALSIEVLDIDLAGEIRPFSRVWPDTRVMRGRADWPMIALRYTLRDGTRVMATGEERIADLAYLTVQHAAGAGEALHFEKRMLSKWFAERFGQRP